MKVQLSGLMEALVRQKKSLVLILVKQAQNFAWVWVISNGFSATESREVSLNENAYDFSVDNNSIDISVILNIRKYLMNKNNIK